MKRLVWIAALALLLAAGCGGPRTQVETGTELPPVDFSIRPPAGSLGFEVEGSQVMEVMGTSVENFFRFEWTAGSWRDEGDSARTAMVRFEEVRATERRGQAATPEPLKSFDKLEGYSTRFRLDAGGFGPVTEPVRDPEFMQAWSVLKQGLSPFDFRGPGRPIAPGESWQETVSPEELGPIAEVATDSTLQLTYTGNVKWKRRDCARVEVSLALPLSGEIRQGPATSRVEGSIESSGAGLYDLELGFFVFWRQSSTVNVTSIDFDEEGQQLGGEKKFSQTGHLEITHLGL